MNNLNVPIADTRPPRANPADIELTADQFHFVYHTDTERFFRGPRPYRIIQSKPALTTYTNAIYTPAVRGGPKVRFGCLYDEALNRIDGSMNYRTRHDELFNMDPERFTGDVADLAVYDRPLLYMGHLRPHFGHFTMETLAGWWALTEENLDVDRFLFHVNNPGLLNRSYIKASLDAMQFNEDNMLWFDKPMRLSKVIVPQSSFQLLSHIFTKYRAVLNKLSIAFGADRVTPTDQPVFFSRRFDTRGVRQYVGQEKVEDFLASRGVRVVAPNQFSFAEQFQLVNAHKTILGFQGSQLANIIGALEPRKVVYLTDRKVWGNCLLIDRCFDHETTYVNVCETDEGISHIYRGVKKRLTGKKTFKDGFQKLHKVDVDKAIAWFQSTGIV